MNKFPPISAELRDHLISYQHSLHQLNPSHTQYRQQNITFQEPAIKQSIQSSIPNQTANQINSQYTITNTSSTTTTNPTILINKTNKSTNQLSHNPLSISDKQSTSTNQSEDKPLSLSDLSSTNNLTKPLSTLNPPVSQPTHQLIQHSFQNISQINPTQTSPSSPLDMSINCQPNSFDNIDNNISISTLTSFNSSQLSSMQIDHYYSPHSNSLILNSHFTTIDSFDKF